MTVAETGQWAVACVAASDALRAARAAIQVLEALTEGDAAMKLAFAAAGTYGPEALLREADQIHRQLTLPLGARR